MSGIDWSKAPVGYPIWVEPTGGGKSGWHKDAGDRYVAEDGHYWTKSDEGYYTVHRKPERAVPAPGTVCQISPDCQAGRWQTCEILAVGQQWIAVEIDTEHKVLNVHNYKFRDAEAGEIDKLAADLSGPATDPEKAHTVAQHLYAKGWRKLVQP